MYRSRLIFVEGIMGSGKPTTARWLARLFRRAVIPGRPVAEARPHPANVFRTLPIGSNHTRSYANWQAFVTHAPLRCWVDREEAIPRHSPRKK